jgi:hypothetical protein
MLRIGRTAAPSRLQVDDHLREPGMAVLRRRLGAHQGDHVVIAVGIGGPELGAVDQPAALDPLRPRAHRRQIRARVRFAHADGKEALAPGNGGQVGLPLDFGAEAQQQVAALAVGDPVRAHRRPRRHQFFRDHVTLEEAALAAAITFRPGHADPATLAQLAGKLRVVAGGEVGVRPGQVRALAGEELPDLATQRPGLLGQADPIELQHAKMTLSVSEDG